MFFLLQSSFKYELILKKLMISQKYSIQESRTVIEVLLLSIGLWILALIISMIFMSFLGINPQNEKFGLNHAKYWNFELLMTPTYIIIGLLVLIAYYKYLNNSDTNWIVNSLLIGILIMIVQFIADLIVIIGLFQNSLNYFIGLVTISYLIIPIWSMLSKWISFKL